MDKKGAELTMNYLIVAIIGLIVLIIVLLIFRTQVNAFMGSISDLISSFGAELKKLTAGLLAPPKQ